MVYMSLVLDSAQLQTLEALQNYDNNIDFDDDEDNEIQIDDILDGTSGINISHGGGELLEAVRAVQQEREEEVRRK
jgi:hypothetical protein